MTASELAHNASRFILDEAIVSGTGIVASQYFEPTLRKWTKRVATIDDFGDYLHYIRWYGEMFYDDEAKNFPIKQLELWNKFKLINGLYASPINAMRNKPSITRTLQISLYDHQDGMLGLLELYEQTKNDAFLKASISIGNFICGITTRYGGLIPHQAFLEPVATPWTLCFSEVGGLYMENLCVLWRLTGDAEYLRTAQLIAKRWIENEHFKNTGLSIQAVHHWFPWASYNLKWHFTKPMKDNTNLIFGLIALYKTTNDERYAQAITHALQGLRLLRKDGYCFWYDFKSQKITDSTELLTQNHPVIDVHIEAYLALKEPLFLEEAKRLTDLWLLRKDTNTGLIPEAWIGGRAIKTHCRIDAFTDFHTNCLKLAEITGDEKYREASDVAIKSMMVFAGNENHWWAELVDAYSGHILPHLNQTKFVGGPLRYFLLCEHVRKGGLIYDDSRVLSLIRDR